MTSIAGNFPLIAFADNYGYFLSPTLHVVDISNPTNSVEVASGYEFGWNLAVSGDYLYLVMGTNYFTILNISNRTNPVSVFISNQQLASFAAVQVSGRFAYYKCDSPGFLNESVAIFDISNPTNATQDGFCPVPLSGYYVMGMLVSGNYLYLSDYGGLNVYALEVPPPLLTIDNLSNGLVQLWWPTPSPDYVVQESQVLNQDLSRTNWISLTNAPVVVGTNNQLTLPMRHRTAFYRLHLQ